jgi:Xaa-Pro aminopeptidase
VIWLYYYFRKIQWQTKKAVYNAVLRVKNEATKMLVPGTLWKQYHIEVGKLMTSELLGLGRQSWRAKRKPRQACLQKYFMHGTSHHMGLDTHDYGVLTEPMQANMVFTELEFISLKVSEFAGRRPRDSRKRRTIQPNAFLLKRMKLKVWWTSLGDFKD